MSRNFTDEPPEDEAGHGTRVASIIAGSGAASGGRYRGVAPGAQLLSAKACGPRDCYESSVVAGLHWAVAEEGARVVNLSIGDRDAPGLDPVELAVSTLAGQYGALFVVSAGNSGPSPQTITRPANLGLALTVGAVDADDRVAFSSSRGLTVGDAALKPDLTAPSFVMAAMAAGAPNPTDDPRLRASRRYIERRAARHRRRRVALRATPQLDGGRREGRAHEHGGFQSR